MAWTRPRANLMGPVGNRIAMDSGEGTAVGLWPEGFGWIDFELTYGMPLRKSNFWSRTGSALGIASGCGGQPHFDGEGETFWTGGEMTGAVLMVSYVGRRGGGVWYVSLGPGVTCRRSMLLCEVGAWGLVVNVICCGVLSGYRVGREWGFASFTAAVLLGGLTW
ncbi:hypothetical protein Tco_0861530 [Tanacetum coccineum]|uniref:Uncharacterized protein n=1 Tax=Tanacetum coccineum TaxID=301880 RepID=A0ABQ5BL23_9ASTR